MRVTTLEEVGRGSWRSMWIWLIVVLVGWECWLTGESHSAERYVARFADATVVEANELREWTDGKSSPKMGERMLFDALAPVRWVADRSQDAMSQPEAYVEFGGGDRLAGEVIAYVASVDRGYEVLPSYLVVRSTTPVPIADSPGPISVCITTDWVQRVVWRAVGERELKPGTIWFKTGASTTYRSLRWNATSVTILTGDGIQQVPFTELGEIHLSKLDQWQAYAEQSDLLSPAGDARFLQIQTQDGSRITTSLERFQARISHDRPRTEQACQLVQPAWAILPVAIRVQSIVEWKFFSRDQVALSRFVPSLVTHQPVFGQGLDWQIDRTVQARRLSSLDQEFGWGFGVHGTSSLTFDLPPSAQAVRTQCGLDRTAGAGGCVNFEIVDGAGNVCWKKVNVVGARAVEEMDWTPIPTDQGGRKQITFRTEMAHAGRPEGADPFDVRDIANWYEPEIRLERNGDPGGSSAKIVSRLPGLIGWNLNEADVDSLRLGNALDNGDPENPEFRVVLRSLKNSYRLTRSFEIGPHDRWLALVVDRIPDHSPSSVEVRIADRSVGTFAVPIRPAMIDPDPILIPVGDNQGRTVSIDVVVSGADENAWCDWRGLFVGPDRPGVIEIFDEDQQFSGLLNAGDGKAAIDAHVSYSGQHSLKVTPGPGAIGTAQLPNLQAPIREFPRLGQYRYLVFAWKQHSGKRIQLQLAANGRLGETNFVPMLEPVRPAFPHGLVRIPQAYERGQRFRYCYEEGVASTEPPLPLWMHGNLPRDWQLIQRDLFQDFGEFAMTGISFQCIDGEQANFDHIYLARTSSDLEYLALRLANDRSIGK